MDDELVEKVARAMIAKEFSHTDIHANSLEIEYQSAKDYWNEHARAAIAAMREAGWTPPNNTKETEQ